MEVATRDTEMGHEISSMPKAITLERMRLFSGWPMRNIHTDEDIAKMAGLPGPVAQGPMSVAYISEMLTGFFGESWLKGGKLSVSFIGMVQPRDTITAKGIIREKVAEGEAVRLVLEVWCQNQRGEKVTVGTASGLVA